MAQRQIGKYLIIETIASGGFGTVYRAMDTELSRVVALKVLHSHIAGDADYVARFLREARTMASLNHPNVVSIYEVGQDGDTHYIAMEYLPSSLHQLLQSRRTLPVDQCLRIARQIAEALRVAHRHGVIHRDLKPQNILLTEDGIPKVADYGIARVESLSTMTATGMIMGTPHYMSPEQGEGRRVDARSDIYSLGCVLYQMLSGRTPFEAGTPWEVVRQHIEVPPEGVRKFRSEVPFELEDLVSRCLSKDPNQRFQRASDLAQAIARLMDHSGASSGNENRHRGRLFAGSSVGLVAVLLVIIVFFFWSELREIVPLEQRSSLEPYLAPLEFRNVSGEITGPDTFSVPTSFGGYITAVEYRGGPNTIRIRLWDLDSKVMAQNEVPVPVSNVFRPVDVPVVGLVLNPNTDGESNVKLQLEFGEADPITGGILPPLGFISQRLVSHEDPASQPAGRAR